jgi:hypothetical protein
MDHLVSNKAGTGTMVGLILSFCSGKLQESLVQAFIPKFDVLV